MLAQRQSDARAALRYLRQCGREIERIAAQARAVSDDAGTEPLQQRAQALTAEADHIRLELANWDVAGSPSWTEQIHTRLDRLASAIATVPEPELAQVVHDRVVVWPRRAAGRPFASADTVERTIYDYLYPRPGPAIA